jgi:hypothetical protein
MWQSTPQWMLAFSDSERSDFKLCAIVCGGSKLSLRWTVGNGICHHSVAVRDAAARSGCVCLATMQQVTTGVCQSLSWRDTTLPEMEVKTTFPTQVKVYHEGHSLRRPPLQVRYQAPLLSTSPLGDRLGDSAFSVQNLTPVTSPASAWAVLGEG